MIFWNGKFITAKTVHTGPGIYNLQSQAVYEKNGTWPRVLSLAEGGLAGKIFAGSWRSTIAAGNIGSIPLTTTDNSPSNFPSGNKGIPSGYDAGVNVWDEIDYSANLADNYGFIAIGYFKPPSTGDYTFFTNSDDGSGVWVGSSAFEGATRTAGNAVVNNGMGTGHGVQERSGTIALTANVYYAIRIVHEETSGGDAMRFSWQGPGNAKTEDLSNHYYYAVSNNVVTGDFE